MNLDQLNGLLALKVLAETRNFRAAAQQFDVTPSAVSQTIKQLEQRLGVALLSPTTRSTSLTEAGARFLSETAPVTVVTTMSHRRLSNRRRAPLSPWQ